jgi:primosomal protein N' (replication factor Y)
MTTYSKYIDIAIALPVYNTFTYRVPENFSNFISVGKRALVPFGKRKVTGYILGSCEKKSRSEIEIKSILDILDENPLFPSSILPFFRWISEYYIYPIGEVIKSALPGGLNLYEYAIISITENGKNVLKDNSVPPIQREILSSLESEACQLKNLCKIINKNIPNSLIQTMENLGLIVSKRELKGGKTRLKSERYVLLTSSEISVKELSDQKKKIIDALKQEGELSVKKLKEIVPSAPGLIKSLENKGYISIIKKRVYRDPFGESIETDRAHILTKEQEQVISKVVNSFNKGFSTFLLAGVTGSGKTEVYMQIAAEAIKKEYKVLVLVPEIALISQMERRFRARFGECIAVLHSGLSAGERYDQWMRLASGEATIAIGARSAIFAPFDNVEVIIVDEEHDISYKQESGLRYNARDLAVVRAKLNNGVALLGSATPSIQSYYNVTINKFTELTLKRRIEKRSLPEITIIDLRKSRDYRGVKKFISSELHEAMKETLERGEQILLFLNRRGFASFPVCSSCGRAIRCKNCDISLTFHKRANAYKCHYCGFTLASTSNCPTCGSAGIKLLGLGTEKIEAAVKSLFPNAKTARMDRDTTTRKGSVLKLLKGLKNLTIDILVGTQMIAKGHDFPNITLVGIICADLSLSLPDFRAGERTFQILAQVSGRAGRGNVSGRVILQTFNPEHFSILSAKTQDFKEFYNKEIHFRKSLKYPPFSRMVQIKISGNDKEKTRQHALAVGDLCNNLKKNNKYFIKTIEILGPIEAPLPRIAKQYRWQILLKSLSVRELHNLIHLMMFRNTSKFYKQKVKVVVDMDPFFMM